MTSHWIRFVGFVLVIAAIALLAVPSVFGLDIRLPDRATLEGWIAAAGLWGPVLIVTLMTAAIVASPIPSAPIAMAAGAAYGHIYGTLLVIIGAEAGAILAFVLARWLGRPFVERQFGDKLGNGLMGSQTTLMLIVFGSRLLPFLSFDMISYAAGLSKLHLWRFAIATFAGIIPASYLLAHLGSQAMNGDARTASWTALALGAFTGLSVIYGLWRQRLTPTSSSET